MNIFLDSKRHIQVQRLEPFFTEKGHSLSKVLDNCNVQLSLVYLRHKTKLPIVLRLDGIYYDLDISYKAKNRLISKAHSKASGIIYQSQNSMDMCEKYLSKRNTTNYDIVYNGIEENWNGDFIEHEGINIITTAKWRRWKRLPEIIEIFKEFNRIVPKSKLHIIGRLHNNKVIKYPNIVYYGMIDFTKMSEIYKTGDMFIHLAKNDPCPKTVVEAIGSGMPIITSSACGGATEMARLTDGCVICKGDILSLEADYVYKDEWNKTSDTLKKKVIRYMVEISNDKRRVKLPNELNIKTTAEKYLKVMENCIK